MFATDTTKTFFLFQPKFEILKMLSICVFATKCVFRCKNEKRISFVAIRMFLFATIRKFFRGPAGARRAARTPRVARARGRGPVAEQALLGLQLNGAPRRERRSAAGPCGVLSLHA